MSAAIKRRIKSVYLSILMRHFPKQYADFLYYKKFKKKINWKDPKDLNEKINWLAFKTDTKEWTRLADKFSVREFVREKGLEHILIPLIGRWDNVEDIDWDILPNQFVIRTNCGYGDTSIVYDKSSVDIEYIKRRLKCALSDRFGFESAERHYTRIKPCIVAEKLISTSTESHSIGQSTLVDYKVLCFGGEPMWILTGSNRDTLSHTADFNIFDLHWNRHYEYVSVQYQNDVIVKKPVHLDRMLAYARTLSAGFPEVRVDFYESEQGDVLFGEMTFTNFAGRCDVFSELFLNECGRQIKLC